MGYVIDPRNFNLSGTCDNCGKVFVGGIDESRKQGWELNVKAGTFLCKDCKEKRKEGNDLYLFHSKP